MKTLDEQVIKDVRSIFERKGHFAPLEFDERVKKFESNWRQTAENRWIMYLLRGAGMSYQMVAEKLGTSRQDIQQTEAREISGQVTLKKMRQIASAADCDFVYAFVPKNKGGMTHTIIGKSAEFLELQEMGRHTGTKNYAAAISIRVRRFLAKPTGWGILWGHSVARKRKYDWRFNDVSI